MERAVKKMRTPAVWWLADDIPIATLQAKMHAAHVASSYGASPAFALANCAGWLYGTLRDVTLGDVRAWLGAVLCVDDTPRVPAWNDGASARALVLHDVAFSNESLEQYGTAAEGRNAAFNAAIDRAAPRGLLCWLDMALPMYSKARVMPLAYVGVLHAHAENKPRFRVLSIFRRQLAVARPTSAKVNIAATATTTQTPSAIAQRYNAAAARLGRPLLHLLAEQPSGETFFSGKWMCGNDYRNKSTYHGAYPASLLDRYDEMLPTRQQKRGARILHLFSGSLEASPDYIRLDAVRDAELRGNAEHLVALADGKTFDVIFADPPYSLPDAVTYKNAALVDRARVLDACARVLAPGGWLVWLDCVTWSHVAVPPALRVAGLVTLIRSTNHRFRLITFFYKA